MKWDGRALNVPAATRSAFDRADYARLIVVDGEVYCIDNRDNIIPMGGTSNPDIGDPRIAQAINVIQSTYGDTVSVNAKKKNLLKFGRSEVVGSSSYTTVMSLPSGIENETYISTNSIDEIVSTSGSDTFTVGIEGHTISGTDLSFAVQSVVLNGTTPVSLPTPLARCTRLAHNGTNGANNVGTVSCYDSTMAGGVSGGNVSDGTSVHCIMPIGRNQSEKCATSTSSQDYWLITGVNFSVLEKTSSTAEFRLEVRSVTENGVFKPVFITTAANTTPLTGYLDPLGIVPKNCDVRVVAKASGSNVECSANLNGILAIVT